MGLMMLGMSACSHADDILNGETDTQNVLSTKTKDIGKDELFLAIEIGERLKVTLASKGPVAAGLAAPQIGISRSVFIYSYDRTPEHLTLVINPTFEPIGDKVVEGWEACFSGMKPNGEKSVAKMQRFEVIRVTYMNEKGEMVKRVLDGFAAKVFQHEYDHLQGYVNIGHPKALEVKTFPNSESFEAFMTTVRAEDKRRYNKSES